MATKPKEPSLWDQLPKEEQERIKRQLHNTPEPNGKRPKSNGKGGFELRGYLRCELSAADKDQFREWEQTSAAEQCMDRLIKAVDSGYLLKVGEAGQGFQASLCAASTSHTWDGFVLTAHAATAGRAAALLVFKHEELMQGDWTAWLTDEGDDWMR